MGIIGCRFFIKSNLLIPDNLAFMGKLNDRKYCVAVNKKNVRTKQSFGELLDEWNDPETIRSEFWLFNNKEEKRISQEIYFNQADIFKYGYIEHDTANIILVMFDDEENTFTHQERHEECVNISMNILHNFIDVYRLSSQIGNIPNAKNLISPFVQLSQCIDNKLSEYDDECNFQQFAFRVNEKNRQGFFNSIEVGDEILNIFANNLLKDKKIEVYEKLIVDAREQAFVKKDYSMSIVLIETAFETYLKFIFQKYCFKKNILALESPFEKKCKINYIKAISNSNVKKDILNNYFVNIIKLETKKTIEFENWNNKAYKRRNEIIHSGKNNYGIIEAEEAFKSTIEFMNFIGVNMYKKMNEDCK
ncbi:MAG: hypothetical protein WBA54_01730 [Acidaminobacteraceae bacterium]